MQNHSCYEGNRMYCSAVFARVMRLFSPLAMSLNRQWKALKCLPCTKNTPKGVGLEAEGTGGIMMEGCTWQE